MTDDNDPYRLLPDAVRNEVESATSELSADHRHLGGLGGLVVVACIVNFLAFPILRGADGTWPLVAMVVGYFCAQFGLATMYLVWGTEPFHIRLVKHWGVALGLFGSWAIGFALAVADQVNEILQIWGVALCSLPLFSLASQLPLWPLRIYLGWRIERSGGAAHGTANALSIRDMILGTVVTAVTLAALRLVPGLTGFAVPREPEIWMVWAIWGLSIAGASTVALIPATFVCFRLQDGGTAAGMLGGIAVVAWVITLSILGAMGPGGGMPGEVPAGIALVYGSFTATLALPLFIIRSRGYRLTFAGERLTAPSPPPAAPPASPEQRAE
jgi:hypothetical protein